MVRAEERGGGGSNITEAEAVINAATVGEPRRADCTNNEISTNMFNESQSLWLKPASELHEQKIFHIERVPMAMELTFKARKPRLESHTLRSMINDRL